MKRGTSFGAALPPSPEERLAHRLIKGMLASSVDNSRIHSRKMKTYFLVMLDGANTKPICRLYTRGKITIGWITERKVEVREPLRRVEDIGRFDRQMTAVVKKYLSS